MIALHIFLWISAGLFWLLAGYVVYALVSGRARRAADEIIAEQNAEMRR